MNIKIKIVPVRGAKLTAFVADERYFHKFTVMDLIDPHQIVDLLYFKPENRIMGRPIMRTRVPQSQRHGGRRQRICLAQWI